MSKWTHVICALCWLKRNPDRQPVTVVAAPVEVCCFCFAKTTIGIHVRQDPGTVPCRGVHDTPVDAIEDFVRRGQDAQAAVDAILGKVKS